MDEIEMLTRLRDEVPREVSPQATCMFAEGLAREQAGEPAARHLRAAPRLHQRRRPGWRLALAGGLAAVLAAGAAGAALRSPAPARSAALTVSELAYRAAAAAARQPAVRPGQWVYRDLYTSRRAAASWLPPGTAPHWATADNSTDAFYVHGKLITGRWSSWTPLGCSARGGQVPCPPGHHQTYLKLTIRNWFISYRQLRGLPASPPALVRALADRNPHGYVWDAALGPVVTVYGHQVHGRLPQEFTSRPFRAYNVISFLLSTYIMTPALTAELYHALADIAGIQVNAHATDVAGQHGIGFVLPMPGSHSQFEDIILNSRTYQLMAFGDRQQGTAILRQALVSGPGATPGS